MYVGCSHARCETIRKMQIRLTIAIFHLEFTFINTSSHVTCNLTISTFFQFSLSLKNVVTCICQIVIIQHIIAQYI